MQAAEETYAQMSMRARLSNRAVLEISGPEAAEFLNGLITADLDAVDGGSAAYAALLTPQGKILFLSLIHI